MAFPSGCSHLAAPPALCPPQGLPTPARPIKRTSRDTGPSKVMAYVGFTCTVVAANAPVLKCATYGKPVHHSVNRLKFARSLQSVAKERAGHHCGALRGKESPHPNSMRLSSLTCPTKLRTESWHPADHLSSPHARGDAHREMQGWWRATAQEGPSSSRLLVLLALQPGEGATLSAIPPPLTEVMFAKFTPNKQFKTVMPA